MSAVILCEFPSERADARSWILDRVTMLAINGHANVKFIGTETPISGKVATEVIAIEMAIAERARELLSAWQQDARFPGLIETRLLSSESVRLDIPIFL